MSIPITYRALAGLTILLLLGIVYFYFDPALYPLFPRCPVYAYTGLQCPGCGSQRAIHQLLHGDIIGAARLNLMAVIAIPYLLLGVAFEMPAVKGKYPKARNVLFGARAIWVILAVILVFTVGRNLI